MSKEKNSIGGNLMRQAIEMAREKYVSLPLTSIYADRKDQFKEKHWEGVFNCMYSAEGMSVADLTIPTSSEMQVESKIGTDGLGYMTWGSDNKLPNHVDLLTSLLPYTAVGIKFNQDVLSGLGPKPKYRYSYVVNGSVVTKSIDYEQAGMLILAQLIEARRQLVQFRLENVDGDTLVFDNNLSPQRDYSKELEDQLKERVDQLENEYKVWRDTNFEVEAFLERTDVNELFANMSMNMALYGVSFPEVVLDKQADVKPQTWNPKIIALAYNDPRACRFERMDKNGVINYVYKSNRWVGDQQVNVESFPIVAVPAIDPSKPLLSLQKQIRDYRMNSRSRMNGKPTNFILTCKEACVQSYYPIKAFYSIFHGGIYKYVYTMIENRAIAKDNSRIPGKIIYVHADYLDSIYKQQNATTREKQDSLRNELWNQINDFLRDGQNNGKTMLSFTFRGSDGKDRDAIRIVDVPVNDKQTTEANKQELEEVSNVIFLAMQIHSVLIGNSIGASKTGGTMQREMYELKKLMSMPTQRIMLKPFYLVRDFNGWDKHLEWEVGQMTLTTLDRNANGIEETNV